MTSNDTSLLDHEEMIDPGDYEHNEPAEPAKAADASDKGDKGEKKPDADAGRDEVRQLRQEIKRERESRLESERNAQYWQSQARDGQRAPRREEPEEEIDVVDLLTKEGSKGLDRYLEKKGFVRGSQVEERIAQERSKIQYEASLLRQYPELEDDDSPLFQQTKKEYSILIKDDPSLQGSPATMKMAARLASAQLKAGGKGRDAEPEEDYDPPRRTRRDDAEDEDDRVRRVSSQQAPRGRRPSAQREGADDLSPIQKSIVERLRDAGANITEDGYRKRAAAGVRMGGLPGRGR